MNEQIRKTVRISKKAKMASLAGGIILAALAMAVCAADPAPSGALVVADFEGTDHVNKLGGELSAWSSGGADPAGVISESIDPGAGTDGTGGWKIVYDISNDGSYCGSVMKLNGLDATPYKTLSFQVKGDMPAPTDFIVELKVGDESSLEVKRYVVRGVTTEWTTLSIPLSDFRLTKRKPMFEMATVFDKPTTKTRKGMVQIDNIRFLP